MAKSSSKPSDAHISKETGMPPDSKEKTPGEKKQDQLWKILNRFDFYIGSTNAKAALLIAFNTFIFGSIVLKANEVFALFGDFTILRFFAVLGLLVAAVSSLFSLWFTFQVIKPYLASPRHPKNYHSILFFNHVAEFTDSDYVKAIDDFDDSTLLRDLALQAHAVANGLKSKFEKMSNAVNIIIYIQLPSVLIVVGLLATKLASVVLEAKTK